MVMYSKDVYSNLLRNYFCTNLKGKQKKYTDIQILSMSIESDEINRSNENKEIDK